MDWYLLNETCISIRFAICHIKELLLMILLNVMSCLKFLSGTHLTKKFFKYVNGVLPSL